MSRHRQYDTIIVGGSFAGLSAAIYLGRACRSVLILDTGAPRNRFAAESHGFFAQDGAAPHTMIATMRANRRISNRGFCRRRRGSSDPAGQGIQYSLGQRGRGHRSDLAARPRHQRYPARFSGRDRTLGQVGPPLPLLHGYEFSGQRLGVLNVSPMSIHQAMLIPEWGPTTFFLDGGEIDSEAAADLDRCGVSIEPAPVEALIGEGSHLSAVRLRDGRDHPLDAVFIAPRYRFNCDLAEQLGCAIDEGPLGSTVTVNEMKATSVAGVYAAGDITRAGHTVTFACADGVMAALGIHRSLAFGMGV